jgi:hypothetical protein
VRRLHVAESGSGGKLAAVARPAVPFFPASGTAPWNAYAARWRPLRRGGGSCGSGPRALTRRAEQPLDFARPAGLDDVVVAAGLMTYSMFRTF